MAVSCTGSTSNGSVDAMTSEDRAAPDIAAVDELRFLADALRRVDAATAAAHWDDEALDRVLAEARAELASLQGAIADDIAAAAASAAWRERADGYAHSVTLTRGLAVSVEEAGANAVVAVTLARAAVAEAILAVSAARGTGVD